MRIFMILLGICSLSSLSAQKDTVRILFVPMVNGQLLSEQFNESEELDSGKVVIDKFLFYASQVALHNQQGPILSEDRSYHLIDSGDSSSLSINLITPNKLSFSDLRFFVGVDSLTNVSGAFGGDLDPTKGMYWTWQSGYINFKLEGRSTECPSRKNQFQFHLGGYLEPCYAIQEIILPINQASLSKEIIVYVNLDTFLDQVNLRETYEIMSPNEKAMNIADLLPSIFSLTR